jgi:hypothetical protein
LSGSGAAGIVTRHRAHPPRRLVRFCFAQVFEARAPSREDLNQ